ncbi:hypothetical protein AB9F39_38620, partial [Rhizobium leguminosarum]
LGDIGSDEIVALIKGCDGAIYAFLKIDGVADSRKAALDIVDKTGVGLAPGTALGPGGELFLRACFLRDPTQVAIAAER